MGDAKLTNDTPLENRPNHWYLRVKTLQDEYLVDVGTNAGAARIALENAKRSMSETGAVTIADGLVVNASDIESIALQDTKAATRTT
jgi:hypothetical protein